MIDSFIQSQLIVTCLQRRICLIMSSRSTSLTYLWWGTASSNNYFSKLNTFLLSKKSVQPMVNVAKLYWILRPKQNVCSDAWTCTKIQNQAIFNANNSLNLLIALKWPILVVLWATLDFLKKVQRNKHLRRNKLSFKLLYEPGRGGG